MDLCQTKKRIVEENLAEQVSSSALNDEDTAYMSGHLIPVKVFMNGKEYHYMDTIAPPIDVSEEVARESLIAISQFNPEKNLATTEQLPADVHVDGVGLKDTDKADDFRSKLISISYIQLPEDGKTISVSPGALVD